MPRSSFSLQGQKRQPGRKSGPQYNKGQWEEVKKRKELLPRIVELDTTWDDTIDSDLNQLTDCTIISTRVNRKELI